VITILVLVAIHATTLTELESIQNEWISPGYSVSKETLVEFSDHGPLFSNEDQLFVGSHVCYVDIEGIEKWRATILYEDRVILFQEDLEPIVTLFDFPVDNCSFSESGNYVVLHDGGAVDTDKNGLRINATTGESLFFDAQPEGMLGRSLIVVWDDGRLRFGRATHDRYYRMFWLSNELEVVNIVEMNQPGYQGISTNYYMICFDRILHAYNSEGFEEWSYDLIADRHMLDPYISDFHECFLLASDEVIQVISLTNGEVLRSYSLPEESIPRYLSINEEKAEFTCVYTNNFTRFSLTASITDHRIVHPPEQVYFDNHSFIDESENVVLLRRRLVQRDTQRSYTYLLSDRAYNVVYASPLFIDPYIWGVSDQGNHAALSGLGNELVISTSSEVVIITLEKE
jgi:hypothetical protein